MKLRNQGSNLWIAAAGAAALLLYLLTLAPGFMPGESAFALTQSLPGSLFPTFGHALWHSLVRGLDGLPGDSLYVKTGVFAALTGSLAVAGVLGIAARIPLGDTPEEQRTPVPEPVRRWVCVGVAALVALFSPPLWFGATRPLPQMFGLACLALLGAWTVATFRKRSPAMLTAAAPLWGWIGTEYAAAWFFSPFFLLAVLLTGFDANGRFRIARNLRLLGLFLLGAALGYLFVSVKVLGHPHAELQGMENLWEAMVNTLRVQWTLLRQTAPARGSLLVLFLFGGPFLLVLMPKGGGTLEVRFGSVLLHAACGVINGLMLFHPPFSPWGLYVRGQLETFMVIPSAMLAVSTGYLAAYWIGVLFKYDPYQPAALRVPRYVLRAVIVPVLALLLAASTVFNLVNQRDPDLAEVNRLARDMAASLASTDLYLGESGFNNVLRLQLRRIGADTRVVDLSPGMWSRGAYRRIVAGWFASDPRLSTLAEVGAGPLIIGLAEADAADRRAFVLGDHPDFLYRAGRVPLPVAYGYVPREEAAAGELADIASRLHGLWRNMDAGGVWERVGEREAGHRGSAALARFFASESRRANNLGVLLEEKGEVAAALESYRLSRGLMPANLSALMNLVWHADSLPEAERETLLAELETVLARLGNSRLQPWRLSEAYGYISHPRAYMDRGMAWVVSGVPGLAIRDYREALRRAPGDAGLRLRLAYAHFAGEDLDRAEEEYRRVLEENPESPAALIGLARIYGLRGMTQEAAAYLARAWEAGVDPEVLIPEEIRLAALSGDLEEAARIADRWVKSRPDRLPPLLSRIQVALQRGKADELEPLVEAALRVPSPDAGDRLRLARLLFLAGRMEQARAVLQPLRRQGGAGLPLLELELDMALRERDSAEAERIVREMLEQDPGHARANFVLGSLRMFQGRLPEAESAYRASLEREESPEARNDLANLLLDTRRPEEALEQARRAVELRPGSPVTLDTLAEIQLELGEVEAAYQSILKALEAAPEVPGFRLTLARVHRAAGRMEPARAIADELMTQGDRLTPDQRRELDALFDAVD